MRGTPEKNEQFAIGLALILSDSPHREHVLAIARNGGYALYGVKGVMAFEQGYPYDVYFQAAQELWRSIYLAK